MMRLDARAVARANMEQVDRLLAFGGGHNGDHSGYRADCAIGIMDQDDSTFEGERSVLCLRGQAKIECSDEHYEILRFIECLHYSILRGRDDAIVKRIGLTCAVSGIVLRRNIRENYIQVPECVADMIREIIIVDKSVYRDLMGLIARS